MLYFYTRDECIRTVAAPLAISLGGRGMTNCIESNAFNWYFSSAFAKALVQSSVSIPEGNAKR